MLDPAKPWKLDVDILRSPQYEVVASNHVYCDKEDRLWLPAWICFDASQSEDAFTALETVVVLLSEDGGLTWQITDRSSPAPPHSRVALSDGTIIEMGGRGWIRYPPPPKSSVSRPRAITFGTSVKNMAIVRLTMEQL